MQTQWQFLYFSIVKYILLAFYFMYQSYKCYTQHAFLDQSQKKKSFITQKIQSTIAMSLRAMALNYSQDFFSLVKGVCQKEMIVEPPSIIPYLFLKYLNSRDTSFKIT